MVVGVGQVGGGDTSGAVGSVRDCLDLRRLEPSKHSSPFSRQGRGGQGREGRFLALPLLGPSPALLVSEGPLVGPWATGGSVGPGRSCRGDRAWAEPDSQAKELTCLAPLPMFRLTLLAICLSVLGVAGGSWGSGLAAVGRLGGGSELPAASAARHWALAGSSGGSGGTVVGELTGEAGGLLVPPGGARTRSVTVVTSRLERSGVGVGSMTSPCCSRSSCSGTCGEPIGCSQGSQAGGCPEQGMQSRGAVHGFL